MFTTSRMHRFDSRSVCAAALALALAAAACEASDQEVAKTKTVGRVAQTTGLLAPPAVAKQATPPVSVAIDRGDAGRTLFFGYVEFDQDPDAPGGVHGFRLLPSSASRLATAAASK